MLFEVRDQLGAVDRQGRSIQHQIQQTISESQSAVIDHQTTMTATVRETIAHVTEETRSNQQAVHAALLGSTARGDQAIGMLNQVLEQISRLSLRNGIDASAKEAQDDKQPMDDTPAEEILPYAVLEECIESILTALHNKQGVFSLNEARGMADSLLSLLETMVSDVFLESAATSVSTYQHWCETCTKRDLAQLRRNLMAVQGIALSAQRIAVNENSEKFSSLKRATTVMGLIKNVLT